MAPPCRIYKCSRGGCGFATEDRSQLKACAQCKQALYCCREHQVEHWKSGGHRHECCTPQDNLDSFVGTFFGPGEGPSNINNTVAELLTGAVEDAVLRNKSERTPSGVACGCGLHESYGNRPVVISDMWCPIIEQDTFESTLSNNDNAAAAALDLYLPPVPPALVRRAAAYMQSKLGANVIDKANHQLCWRVWMEFSTGGIKAEEWPQVLSNPMLEPHILFLCYEKDDSNPNRAVSLELVQKSLRSMLWVQQANLLQHRIPVEACQQGASLIGKTLKLNSGIEMVHFTDPAICFPKYTEMQQDWFHRHQSQPWEYVGEPCKELPLIRSPVVAYCCREENWFLIRFNPSIHVPVSLHPSMEGDRRIVRRDLTAEEGDIVFLKVLIAAAEFGDVCAIYGCFDPAQQAAVALKQEDVFIEAVEKLLVPLKTQCGDEGRKHASYFDHEIGLTHELRAATFARRGNMEEARAEQLAAARAFHRSAEATRTFTPSRHIRAIRFRSLGSALTKLGDFAAAKRAFLWATTDPLAWLAGGYTKTVREIPLWYSFRKLWEMEQMTETEQQEECVRILKADRSMTKKLFQSNKGKYLGPCRFCKKTLNSSRYSDAHCGKCHARYCDRDCQRNHWPEHKYECTVKDNNISRDCRKHLGTCSDETRALLSSIPWGDLACTITLSEAARLADEFEARQSTRTP